jgi:hypothetical protein
MAQISFMLFMSDVLFLKLYFLVLKISPLQEGLTIDVPLLYALHLLILSHEQLVGREQVRQDHPSSLSQ